MLDLTYDTPKPKVIAGAKDDWELVIGMEVHAQVSSKAKLFQKDLKAPFSTNLLGLRSLPSHQKRTNAADKVVPVKSSNQLSWNCVNQT